MAKVSIYGIEETAAMLKELQKQSEPIIKAGIYDGARVMADAVKSQIVGIRTEGPSFYETRRREIQKEGLRESMGITSMRNDKGFLNVKIGFDDYNELGQPNAMVARIFESGTSFSSKQPFVKRAVSRARKMTEETMKATIDEKIYALTEGEKK